MYVNNLIYLKPFAFFIPQYIIEMVQPPTHIHYPQPQQENNRHCCFIHQKPAYGKILCH